MKPLTVREARKEDMPAFVRLWRDLNGGDQARKSGLESLKNYAEVLSGIFARHINAASEFLALAESDGAAVGYCLGGAYADSSSGNGGEIRQLAVRDDYRDTGAAGALCRFGRDWFRSRGLQEMRLNPCPEKCLAPGASECKASESPPRQEPSSETRGEEAGCGCSRARGQDPYEVVWQTFS